MRGTERSVAELCGARRGWVGTARPMGKICRMDYHAFEDTNFKDMLEGIPTEWSEQYLEPPPEPLRSVVISAEFALSNKVLRDQCQGAIEAYLRTVLPSDVITLVAFDSGPSFETMCVFRAAIRLKLFRLVQYLLCFFAIDTIWDTKEILAQRDVSVLICVLDTTQVIDADNENAFESMQYEILGRETLCDAHPMSMFTFGIDAKTLREFGFTEQAIGEVESYLTRRGDVKFAKEETALTLPDFHLIDSNLKRIHSGV